MCYYKTVQDKGQARWRDSWDRSPCLIQEQHQNHLAATPCRQLIRNCISPTAVLGGMD